MVNAKKDYPGIWSGIYPASTSVDDGLDGCALCHDTLDGKGFNPYGQHIVDSGAGALDATYRGSRGHRFGF
jgi:hypothetical protein